MDLSLQARELAESENLLNMEYSDFLSYASEMQYKLRHFSSLVHEDFPTKNMKLMQDESRYGDFLIARNCEEDPAMEKLKKMLNSSIHDKCFQIRKNLLDFNNLVNQYQLQILPCVHFKAVNSEDSSCHKQDDCRFIKHGNDMSQSPVNVYKLSTSSMDKDLLDEFKELPSNLCKST